MALKNLIQNLINHKPLFYKKAIDITKNILGADILVNATTVAKVVMSEKVKKRINEVFRVGTKNFVQKGGIIVFSVNTSTNYKNGNSTLNKSNNYLEIKLKTLIDKLIEVKNINKKDNNKPSYKNLSWCIGYFFKNKYTSKNKI